MKMGEAVLMIMKGKGLNMQHMAKMLDIKYQSVQKKLYRNDMTITKALEVLDVLGYEMILQPVEKGRKRDGQILIDGGLSDGEQL